MKYFLIEMIDPNNPVILKENSGSDKPLILTGNTDELRKMVLENAHKGLLVPITFNILDLMEDIFDFIGVVKMDFGEDMDIGDSNIINGPDCLEAIIGDFLTL